MSITRIGIWAVLVASFCAARATAQAPCAGDLNADRVVDGSDIATLLAGWGSPGATDLNADGITGGADLGLLLAAWGACPVGTPAWATLIEAAPDPAVVTDPVLRQQIVATGWAWRVRDTATQIEMLLVPPGSFDMGCSESSQYPCDPDEYPVHAVTLTDAFYIGRYEVTQAQWAVRMGANPSFFQSASAQVPAAFVPKRPVEQVSWNMIQGFLAATGLRLPTEAEWERAYRAGTATAFHSMPSFPNGTNADNQVGNIAWFYTGTCTSGAMCQTRIVGSKAANALGLHDMAGNVGEWVNDWYSSSYYETSPSTNPPGPATGSTRVMRGGSWFYNVFYLRASHRLNYAPDVTSSVLGFRVARTP